MLPASHVNRTQSPNEKMEDHGNHKYKVVERFHTGFLNQSCIDLALILISC